MRIPYSRQTGIHQGDSLIVKKRGGGERAIHPHKWRINRGTPVGEDADLWEIVAWGGIKPIDWENLIAINRPDKAEGNAK